MSKAITHLPVSQNLNGLSRSEGGLHTKPSRVKYLNIGGKKKFPYYKTPPLKTDFTISVQSFAVKLPQTHEKVGEKRFINASIRLHEKGLK